MDTIRRLIGPKTKDIYRKLDYKKQQTRLLHILPSSSLDAPIHCELHIISLDDPPLFDAISYCWGDSTETRVIFMNSKLRNITINLHDALRRFRDETERRVVWADAVCINQGDIDERVYQVKLMHLVYSKAELVRIWLGEADDTTHIALDAISQIDRSGDDPSVPALQLGAVISLPVLLCALATFIERPWFSRTWVVQERQLARWNPEYYVGDQIVVASRLKIMLFAVWFQKLELSSRLSTRADCDLLARLTTRIPQVVTTTTSNMATEEPGRMGMLLESLAPLQCTDPRDKVFGVMALLPALRSIPVDYDSPPAELYMAATVCTMLHENSLDILMASSGQIHVTRPGVSWALDLNSPGAFSKWSPCLGSTDVYAASAGEEMQVERADGVIFLWLQGFEFDEVLTVGPRWGLDDPLETSWADSGTPTAQPKTVADVIAAGSFKQWSTFLQVTDSIFWDVVLCGLVQDNCQPAATQRAWRRLNLHEAESLSHLPTDSEPISGEELPAASTKLLETSVHQPKVGSRPFKTVGGLVGLSSIKASPGDRVLILAGSTIPYLCRIAERDPDRSHYRLVTPCYVHGMMDGEAVRQAREKSRAKGPGSDRIGVFHRIGLY